MNIKKYETPKIEFVILVDIIQTSVIDDGSNNGVWDFIK